MGVVAVRRFCYHYKERGASLTQPPPSATPTGAERCTPRGRRVLSMFVSAAGSPPTVGFRIVHNAVRYTVCIMLRGWLVYVQSLRRARAVVL